MKIAAVLPIRALDDGKQRLRDLLTHGERSDLIRRLFERTLAALRAAAVADQIAAVSPDDPTLAWIAARGVLPIKQWDRGLNAGLEHARRTLLATDQIDALLIVLPDLPLIAPDDLHRFVARGGSERVVLAPDRHGVGTNALLLPVANGLPFCFGSDSFAAHQAVARAAGLTVAVDRSPNLAFDLDTPDDLMIDQVGTALARSDRM